MTEEDLLQGPEDDLPGREVIIIFAVFFEGGLAPLSLVLGWLLGHPPLSISLWSCLTRSGESWLRFPLP